MIHLGIENDIPMLMYILMYATFFASVFWRPNLGIYFMVLGLPMQTARYKLFDLPLGSHFLDILLLGTILGVIVQQKPPIPQTPLTRFLLIFAVFCYLSLWTGSLFIHAPLPLWLSDERFSAWKNYVEMFLFAVVVARAIRERKQMVILVVLMAIATLLVNRSFYSTMADRDTSHFSYDVRDAGLLGYAGVNGLAAFEGMVAAFLLGIYAYTKKKIAKVGILLLVATCCYCLLFSFSRGGYIGFLAGVVTVGLFKARWLLVAVVIVVISWQALLPASVRERITMTTADAEEGQQFDSSSQERIDLWNDAMELFKMNPLTGAGFQTYGYMERVGDFRDTHNYYLKVLAETGVVGVVLYLVLLWRLFQSGTSLFFGTNDPFLRGIAVGFLGLLVTVIVADIFGDRWTYQQVDGYLWVILGLVLRGSAGVEEKPEELEGEAMEHGPVREEEELTAA